MNQFNNLSPELIEFIFNKINFNDLINLRIVDKRFKQICEQIEIKQLNVTDDEIRNYYWFYTNDPIYLKEDGQIEISKFLNYRSIFKLDKHLRRLSMLVENKFNISILNEFKLLEQLQIRIDKMDDNYVLNLENLKIANINVGSYHSPSYSKLTLETNQLFAFKSFRLNEFIFNYPDKILFYETDNSLYNNYDKIKEFINLEYLKINALNHSIGRNILYEFKNLKTLDLEDNGFSSQRYDKLKEFIISILNNKKNSRKPKLQIYLFGVKIINQNQIDQFKWSSDYNEFNNNVLEFQIKNYDLLKDNCCYVYKINYNDLIKLIEIIPSSFASKFSNISQIKANDHIDNEDQFIKFLSDLKYFSRLELINCGLTKTFYHKLVNLVYLNNLECLTIEDNENLDLNFDFILHLKRLCEFKTNQTINNIDLINELLQKHQIFLQFKFKVNKNDYVEIIRTHQNLYFRSYILNNNLKEINTNFVIRSLELDEIISKLENLRF